MEKEKSGNGIGLFVFLVIFVLIVTGAGLLYQKVFMKNKVTTYEGTNVIIGYDKNNLYSSVAKDNDEAQKQIDAFGTELEISSYHCENENCKVIASELPKFILVYDNKLIAYDFIKDETEDILVNEDVFKLNDEDKYDITLVTSDKIDGIIFHNDKYSYYSMKDKKVTIDNYDILSSDRNLSKYGYINAFNNDSLDGGTVYLLNSKDGSKAFSKACDSLQSFTIHEYGRGYYFLLKNDGEIIDVFNEELYHVTTENIKIEFMDSIFMNVLEDGKLSFLLEHEDGTSQIVIVDKVGNMLSKSDKYDNILFGTQDYLLLDDGTSVRLIDKNGNAVTVIDIPSGYELNCNSYPNYYLEDNVLKVCMSSIKEDKNKIYFYNISKDELVEQN